MVQQTATLPMATVKKFIAREHFRLKKEGGICSIITPRFRQLFLSGDGAIESPPEHRYIVCMRDLLKTSADAFIVRELREECDPVEVTLAIIFDRMLQQQHGEEGSLLVNQFANIFYVLDAVGTRWTICVRWISHGWSVAAFEFDTPSGWPAGFRVFYTNL